MPPHAALCSACRHYAVIFDFAASFHYFSAAVYAAAADAEQPPLDAMLILRLRFLHAPLPP